MRAKLAGGADATISVPQLDIHPLLPAAAVPGAPVADELGVQKSDVIPLKKYISFLDMDLPGSCM